MLIWLMELTSLSKRLSTPLRRNTLYLIRQGATSCPVLHICSGDRARAYGLDPVFLARGKIPMQEIAASATKYY